MRAQTLNDLLNKDSRAAVSNVTGREASKVTTVSQRYGRNIVGGWALGKGGDQITIEQHPSIPVFSTYADLLEALPVEQHPNKITIYSPPEAVYGDIKNVLSVSSSTVETIFIITEHVAIEVAAKIKNLCRQRTIDVLGCNTLGVINVHDHVRIGAVGGDQPDETFHPGSATIISNSGNMVNTMAAYLYGAGIGVRFGISTGKDHLILTPLRDLLALVAKDEQTKVVILYVEPGGLYEQEALAWMQETHFPKPLIVYVGGTLADEKNMSLGHAGAVVEGHGTSAHEKIALFDAYLGKPPYAHSMKADRAHKPARGLRIQALHDLPEAARMLYDVLGIERDYQHYAPLKLNPWIINMGDIAKRLPPRLVPSEGVIPSPYKEQFSAAQRTQFGRGITRRDMRNASHASSNDGVTPRVFGRSVMELMRHGSFAETLILGWTGQPASRPFEPALVEQTLIAAFTNGPGSISAQAAKLSASAGNEPHTAMIATLACTGSVHGGNGRDAAAMMIEAFAKSKLSDPYATGQDALIAAVAQDVAADALRRKREAQESDKEFARVPCLGHPVYRTAEVNYDPRERIIAGFLEKKDIVHAFLAFYHDLARALRDVGVTRNVLAVNVDAAIACVWLGICWPLLLEKKITVARVKGIAMAAFALARAAGGVSEYFDHTDFGLPMDMRIAVTECQTLTPPKEGNGER
jgi:succinyl-CoA synthetase alpha subunit